MNASNDRHQLRWSQRLLALAALALLVGLAWPWAASVYHVERAGRWLASGRAAPQVAQQLDQALHWDPDNAQAYRLRAQLREQQGRRTDAAEAWAAYVAERPADPLGLWALATACEELAVGELTAVAGQPCGPDETGRQAVLARLWRSAGYSAAILAASGDQLRQEGKLEEAEAFYDRALVLNLEEASAWIGLGEIREALGQWEAALQAYERVGVAGTDAEVAARAHYREGQILAEAGRWPEAAAELAQAVALMPARGEYCLEYGWALYQAGEPVAEAIDQLELAASLNPRSPWPHLRLASISFAQQDYKTMLAYAEEAARVQPEEPWGWLLRGQALDRLDRLAEAERALRQSLALAPDNAAAYDALGHVLARQGQLPAAIAAYEHAGALAPKNVDYLLRLADIYRANGQVDQAREAYRRVLMLEPDNPVATWALSDMAP